MDPVRNRLEELIREQGADCAGLSRLLGRNAAYVQQFLKRGSPRKLDEDDRAILAQFFGVDEAELGKPQPPAIRKGGATVAVPRLNLGASAGPGALAGSEAAAGQFEFDARWLRQLGAKPDALSIIQVAGDSMEPTLGDGDDIMVDGSDVSANLRDGIYVIRLDDALMVKRLALGPARDRVAVVSDNPAYPAWPEVALDRLDVIGRVVWAGRRIR